jgi:hypothetical protein
MATYSDRNLDQFRAKMRGGGARPNLFECDIKLPVTLKDDDENLKFMIKSAALPGSSMETIRVPYRGRTLKLPGDRSFEPWSITVINDTSFDLRNIFERWSNIMNRYADNAGILDQNFYMKDIIIKQLGRGDTPPKDSNTNTESKLPGVGTPIPIHKKYILKSAFPTNIGDIGLSYDTTSTVEEFSVTFEYQWFDSMDGDSETTNIFAND